MSATIAERVAAGAAWLDQHQPGWVELIDSGRLDLGSPCRCVIGQLDGEYYKAIESRGISPAEAGQLGFDLDDEAAGPISQEWDALTAAWRELIQQRRRAE